MMAKAQQTKKCSNCKELKLTTLFSKQTKSKDGLQSHCKKCTSILTRPLTDKLVKADKNAVIYTITNPIGEMYIGSTKRLTEYRFKQHRATYKFEHPKGYSSFPSLHKSFTLWGVDAHIFEVIKDCGNINKSDLREIESRMIIALKKNGKSLNINN
jgi:hypothetical protein